MEIKTKFNIGDYVYAIKQADIYESFFNESKPEIIKGTIVEVLSCSSYIDGEVRNAITYSISNLCQIPLMLSGRVKETLVFKTESAAKKYFQKHF